MGIDFCSMKSSLDTMPGEKVNQNAKGFAKQITIAWLTYEILEYLFKKHEIYHIYLHPLKA